MAKMMEMSRAVGSFPSFAKRQNNQLDNYLSEYVIGIFCAAVSITSGLS
jgi:hypothetical protein